MNKCNYPYILSLLTRNNQLKDIMEKVLIQHSNAKYKITYNKLNK